MCVLTGLCKADSGRLLQYETMTPPTPPRQPNQNNSSPAFGRDRAHVSSASRECVRNFEWTSKGVVNKGDSFRSNGSSPRGSSNLLDHCDAAVVQEDLPPKALQVLGCGIRSVFHVQILGAAAVGKSSLCQQFRTSEYMGNKDPGKYANKGRQDVR